VLDASLGGLRVRHADPFRPALGTRVTGNLHWIDDDKPLPIRGTIVRVQLTEFAVACDDGILPIAHILLDPRAAGTCSRRSRNRDNGTQPRDRAGHRPASNRYNRSAPVASPFSACNIHLLESA
jgi:hypothetical protein